MNWTHCSKLAVVVFAVLLAAVAPAAAVSVSGQDVPSDAQVGSKQSATFTLTELYSEYDEWTLRAETELGNATWTVTKLDNKGSKIDQNVHTGSVLEVQVGGNTDEVRVRLEGNTPEVSNYTYQPAQTFTFAKFVQSQQGGTADVIETFETRHYTQNSQGAREQLDQAKSAIDSANGADTGEAQTLFGSAKSAFNKGNFPNAKTLGEQAENKANAAAQSSAQMDLIIKLGAAVVALLVVVGAVYWYLNQRETYDKLG